ncbi:uncharacterized protein At1g28695-like [Silene latifolia]|uniref:uncharacterized protein At1g28695-like n=1 Tax=Silene latifolia TaxID=37657 RepID=UPI003D7846D8
METTLNCKKPYYSLQNNISIIIFILGAIFLILFSYSLNSSKSLIASQFLQCPSHQNQITLQTHKDELEETLERTSMPNKTVIIAVVNRAYVEGEVVPNMLDLFLEGFWEGEGTRELVNHLLIVAVDQTAYERCLFRGLHCYKLETDGVDFTREEVFMSSDFVKMMWRRTLFLLDVLQRGYNFIFTDTDVVWLRNPFTILTTNITQHLDIQFSTDWYTGNSSSILNPINTGFYFVKSNNKTISLFKKWYHLKDNSSGVKEQDVLQNLAWQGVLTDLDINFRFLDTKFFSGFCHDSSDIRSVITVHANCCRYIKAKVTDLVQVLSDWSSFKVGNASLAADSFEWSPHVLCKNSWNTTYVVNG